MRISVFWQRVRALIKEKNVTQAVVADACGLSYNTFRKWICKNTIPPLDIAIALSRYFEISLDYLVYGEKADVTTKISDVLVSLQKTNDKLKNALQSAEH